MSRPDPIEYAERLYGAIRAANFSPMSFLAFGNAVKDGVAMRSMPRIAAEPFMRIVGEMLDLEEEAEKDDVIDVAVTAATTSASGAVALGSSDVAVQESTPTEDGAQPIATDEPIASDASAPQHKRRGTGRR